MDAPSAAPSDRNAAPAVERRTHVPLPSSDTRDGAQELLGMPDALSAMREIICHLSVNPLETEKLCTELFNSTPQWKKHIQLAKEICGRHLQQRKQICWRKIREEVLGCCGEIIMRMVIRQSFAKIPGMSYGLLDAEERQRMWLGKHCKLDVLPCGNVILYHNDGGEKSAFIEFDASLADESGTNILFLDACTSSNRLIDKLERGSELATRIQRGFHALEKSGIHVGLLYVHLIHSSNACDNLCPSARDTRVVQWPILQVVVDLMERTLRAMSCQGK